MAEQQDRDTSQDGASPSPAAPLKDAGVSFDPASGAGEGPSADDEEAGTTAGGVAGARQAIIDNVAKGREQAGDKARGFAEDSKARATDALGQLSTLLNDAASQVDDKLGGQYGQYARQAADRVQGLSGAIDAKSVDDIVADVSDLVRKSPAAAIGVAAGLGFVVARVLTAGLDQRDA